MEVVKESSYILSNYEVHAMVTDILEGKNGQKIPNKFTSNLATIAYETQQYLDKTPCKEQTPEQMNAFKTAVAPFKFTKAEILQLINNRPSSAVEISLIIEETDERLSEEDVEKVLDLVAKCFPSEQAQNDDEDEEMRDENETSND